MKPSQYLRKGWVRGNLAVNRIGEETEPHNKAACRWCMIGSLDVSYHTGGIASSIRDEIEEELICVLQNMGYECIEDYNDNDGRKQNEVVELMHEIETTVHNRYKTNPHYNRFRKLTY